MLIAYAIMAVMVLAFIFAAVEYWRSRSKTSIMMLAGSVLFWVGHFIAVLLPDASQSTLPEGDIAARVLISNPFGAYVSLFGLIVFQAAFVVFLLRNSSRSRNE